MSADQPSAAIVRPHCTVHDGEVDNDNGLCLVYLFDPGVPDEPVCDTVPEPVDDGSERAACGHTVTDRQDLHWSDELADEVCPDCCQECKP